jgi:hypothetical protein
MNMDTYTEDRREEDWDARPAEPATETQAEAPLPRRTRRQFFNRRSAALGALVTCAIGFYAGIRVEKSQLSSSSSTFAAGSGSGSGRAAALAARFGGGAGSGSSASSTGAGAGAPGPGAFAGGGAGAANASFGTVAGVKGKTILLTDASGNTVKVKVTASTKITKNQSVSRHAIRPGDTIIVTGGSGSGATTTAATITDSGNRGGGSSSGSGSGGSSGSGSGGGGNSAVGSLFSSGG